MIFPFPILIVSCKRYLCGGKIITLGLEQKTRFVDTPKELVKICFLAVNKQVLTKSAAQNLLWTFHFP